MIARDFLRIFDPGQYFFWLLAASILCFVLERLFPWRQQQRALRLGFWQDTFWLVFNGHLLGIVTGLVAAWLSPRFTFAPYIRVKQAADAVQWIHGAPLVVQGITLLVVKDFLDWCVHNLLHRVPFLWPAHKLHHSILELDFIGNFRFHWLEIAVYWLVTSLPIATLGVWDARAWLPVAVFATLIGHLNHSNLAISWGPLRYVLNSPKMHVWHHERLNRGQVGRNFGIVFSLWDWLFGTAEMPAGQPGELGFDGLESFPGSLVGRLLWPVSLLWPRAVTYKDSKGCSTDPAASAASPTPRGPGT